MDVSAESGAEQIALGDKFFDAGDLARAEWHYRAALEIALPLRDVPAIMVQLAIVLEATGREDEAERFYRRVAATGDPDAAPVALVNLGDLAEKQGRLRLAEKLYRSVIDTGHGEIVTTAKRYLAYLLHRQGRMFEAEHAYREAIAVLGPSESPLETLTLARILRAQGKGADASELYRTVLDQPLLAETKAAFGELADLLDEDGRGDEMERLLRAKSGSSDNTLAGLATWELLRLLMRRRNLAATEAALDDFGGKLDPDQVDEVRIELAIQLAVEGREDDAETRLRAVIDRGTPRRAAQAMLVLGKLLAGSGSLADSEALLSKVAASEWEPYNAEAMVNLAGAAVWRGELPVAQDWLDQAMTKDIDYLIPQVQLGLGGLLAVEGRLEEAESYIKSAMESEFFGVPEQAAAALQLGIVWKRLGLDDKASEMLSVAIRRARLALEQMETPIDPRRWVLGTGTQAMAEVIGQAEELLADST